MSRNGMWDVQNGSCPTTAGPLGEATEVIYDDNSCSLSDTSVVLSAMLSVSPTEELKPGKGRVATIFCLQLSGRKANL